MRALIACLLAVVLTGCADTYKFSVDQTANKMPESVRQKCDPVPKEVSRKENSMGKLYTAYDNLVGLYGECAKRDAAKADWITSQGQ
jgi:hypothetical protein